MSCRTLEGAVICCFNDHSRNISVRTGRRCGRLSQRAYCTYIECRRTLDSVVENAPNSSLQALEEAVCCSPTIPSYVHLLRPAVEYLIFHTVSRWLHRPNRLHTRGHHHDILIDHSTRYAHASDKMSSNIDGQSATEQY
jgi:hypothetical protein